MAHAINSGSAERPCLAICSGSGAFEGVGVTSTPPLHQPTHTHTHTHTATQNPPSPPSSPGRHPARPACISIKQLQANLLPCRVGGVKRGVERRLASLNNGLSDEKALGELDIHYKRATPRQALGPGLRLNLSLAFIRLFAVCTPPLPQPHPNPTSILLTPPKLHTHTHTYMRVWQVGVSSSWWWWWCVFTPKCSEKKRS